MSEKGIQSKAFQRAALSSESNRIHWLVYILVALMLGVAVRNLFIGQFRLLYAQTLVIAVAIAFEVLVLAIVTKARRLERDVPAVVWLVNVMIEAGLPTIGLFILIESEVTDPYQALVAPALLAYFLFIILSTLRLRPGLSLLTGFASAIGYLITAFYVYRLYHNPSGGQSRPTYFIYAGTILAGGVAAAAVAGQIRNHVYAALREAELQQELERVNHDLGIARSIQQGLLPSCSPSVEAFDVAGWNQPAEQTGGDYFDWQTLPDGRVAISLADATGHGIGPALITGTCRAYARASFLSGDTDSLLDNLNYLLAEDLPGNRFVTFAVVLLDPVGSRAKILSAGHGPIIWYRYAIDKIENLEAQGIPLGMMAGAQYGHGTEACLESGDILALVTDGFYEWENPAGEEFGMVRLEAVIRDARDYPADEVISRLRRAVESFCRGTEQKDDLTAVILKRRKESSLSCKAGLSSAATLKQPVDAKAILG